jgi:hypothetical protein
MLLQHQAKKSLITLYWSLSEGSEGCTVVLRAATSAHRQHYGAPDLSVLACQTWSRSNAKTNAN